MTVYCVYITLFCLLGLSKVKNKGMVFACMMLSLAILAALRYETGTDYDNFRMVFNKYVEGETTYTEPVYNFYMKFINYVFGNSVIALYAGEAFIISWGFFYFIKRNVEENYWIYTGALFVITTIFFASMNLTRQYFAMTALFIAFEKVKNEESKLLWVPWCIVAVCVHSSSIVVVLFYIALSFFVRPEKPHQKLMGIMTALIMLFLVLGFIDVRNIFMSLTKILNKIEYLSRYSWYFTTKYFTVKKYSSIIKFIIPNILWLYLYKNYYTIKAANKWADYYFLPFAIYLIINNGFSGINVFIRIGFYFEIAILPLIPICIETVKGRKGRFAARLFFLIYYLTLTVYSIFLNGGHGVVPYQSIFV